MWWSHLSAGEDVAGKFDLGEVALADGLEQPVVADVRLLVGDGVATAGARAAGARSDLVASIGV